MNQYTDTKKTASLYLTMMRAQLSIVDEIRRLNAERTQISRKIDSLDGQRKRYDQIMVETWNGMTAEERATLRCTLVDAQKAAKIDSVVPSGKDLG